MSIGSLAPGDGAIVWRGPQVTKALRQMLRGVAWGSAESPLDILLIDMPPGTGDIHLSLAQEVPTESAIIVTTPQDVAVMDARKCLDMFIKVNIRIAGVIENMSYFTDPAGIAHALFGEGGGERLAAAEKVPFLGKIPLFPALRAASDSGELFQDVSGIYGSIAQKILSVA
jgi:ATP-binding protein involved in chromosome partitioning